MTQDVRDLISHLPPHLKKKVKVAIQSLADNPYQAKELKDELRGLRSYRVTQSRLILRIQKSIAEIVAFGPRKDIYERAAREFSIASRQPKRKK